MTSHVRLLDRLETLTHATSQSESAGLLRRWLARRAHRRAMCYLKDLPPYLLDDIGLLQSGHHIQ